MVTNHSCNNALTEEASDISFHLHKVSSSRHDSLFQRYEDSGLPLVSVISLTTVCGRVIPSYDALGALSAVRVPRAVLLTVYIPCSVGVIDSVVLSNLYGFS